METENVVEEVFEVECMETQINIVRCANSDEGEEARSRMDTVGGQKDCSKG